jgi:hypothetical protein
MANYDVAAKNWVLLRKRGFESLRGCRVIHEGGKSGVTALVSGEYGGYFCIVSCLKTRRQYPRETDQYPIPVKNQALVSR